MASDGYVLTQHVSDKGKGPALDAEAIIDAAEEVSSTETCVICLDHITEKAVALPCKHDQFDFPCLGTWIQQARVCPLCKSDVKAIKYDVDHDGSGSKTFYLPVQDIPQKRSIRDINRRRSQAGRYQPYNRGSRHGQLAREWGSRPPVNSKEDEVLQVRRQVYQRKTYSAYVGANRISQYRNITPQLFTTNVNLISRAKMFIRRELQVFDFLRPSPTSTESHNDRRASNAEFLLEYVIGILKTIDLKGSSGQAEELLKDFLGRENARLFLHELEAWLRSPYERLADWDKHVQYRDAVEDEESSRS